MARPVKFETKLKQGRGSGDLKEYKPWYQVGEKRRGNAHRIKGLKTGRVHHLLSSLERL